MNDLNHPVLSHLKRDYVNLVSLCTFGHEELTSAQGMSPLQLTQITGQYAMAHADRGEAQSPNLAQKIPGLSGVSLA